MKLFEKLAVKKIEALIDKGTQGQISPERCRLRLQKNQDKAVGRKSGLISR